MRFIIHNENMFTMSCYVDVYYLAPGGGCSVLFSPYYYFVCVSGSPDRSTHDGELHLI